MDANNPTPRFKVGNGTTAVNLLPFAAAQADWNITDENDSGYIKNKLYLVNGSTNGSTRGINALAESDSYTMGENAFAIGNGTKASGKNSFSSGQNSEATGSYAHAEGSYTKATKTGAHAEGNYTEANGAFSHTEGYYTKADSMY